MAVSSIFMNRSVAATTSWEQGQEVSSAYADAQENNYSCGLLNQDLDGFVLREDETCYLLTLEMPGVRGNDIQVTLHQNTVLISGYCRGTACSSHPSDRRKRQRVSRHFEIDSNIIDLERAIAKVWNGCLTLYAPKKQRRTTTVSITSSTYSDE